VATHDFSRELTVLAPPAQSWEVLTDVDRLAGWVGIVTDVAEVSRLEKYTAVLTDRVGPFRLRADLSITARVLRDGHEIELEASGRDRAVDSRIAVRAVLRLDGADGGGSTIVTNGRYEVTGRVAAMGAGVIQKKADRILEEFFASAGRELGLRQGEG
jgi:carbon monoxide dehydrogenase subunit G